jgi:hypothetical protein
VDAKTTREDVRTVAALPALLPIVVITARPPPKGRDGGLRSNISALFVLRENTKKAKPSKMVIPKPSFFSLRSLINCTPFFASSSSKRERERRELFVVA